MTEPIPEPLHGADVISWAQPVTRALNALRDKVGAPFRNERDRRGTVVDHGCWNIVTGVRDNETVRQFGNQFYEDGEHNLNELDLEDAVEDFVCQGDLEEGEEYTAADKPFVCLKVPATTTSTEDPTLIGYADISELQAAQLDVGYVIRPLYKFTHNGGVKVDFRNCPFLQVSEAFS